MPTGSSHLAFSIGGIVVLGGSYAWFKAKSLPSLVGALGIGGLLILSGLSF